MSKTLVAYFSASGVTEKVAKKIADTVEADIYEIKPEVKYTKADLNWMNKKSRSSIEMNNKTFRPAMISGDIDVSGKKIILFATAGSSGFGDTAKELKISAPDSEIVETDVLKGVITESKISKLAERIKSQII